MSGLRELGASGLTTPPLIPGGNVFGWTADEAASFAVVDAFADAGGRMIDTADVYSAWMPGHQGLDPKRIAAACEASLARLGVDTIDLYLAHRDDEAFAQEDVAEAFARPVEAGKVRAIGASNLSAERLESALDLAEARGLPRYAVPHPGYNLMERDRFEGPLQDMCVRRGLGATPYFGLANGYLTGKYRTAADLAGSTRGERVKPFMDGRGPEVLAALDGVAEETGAPPAAIALAWVAAQPGVVAPIASATSPAQVAELAQAMTLDLTEDQCARVDRASAA